MKRMVLLFIIVLFLVYLAGEVAKTGKELAFSAGKASNLVNSHQVRLALELYNADNSVYPQAESGDELLEVLQSEGYIEKIPAGMKNFGYFVLENGNEYELIEKP
jgi:hypothetical protein